LIEETEQERIEAAISAWKEYRKRIDNTPEKKARQKFWDVIRYMRLQFGWNEQEVIGAVQIYFRDEPTVRSRPSLFTRMSRKLE